MDKLTAGLIAAVVAVAAVALYGARKEETVPQTQPSIDPNMVIESPFRGDDNMVRRPSFKGDDGIVRRPPTNDQRPSNGTGHV